MVEIRDEIERILTNYAINERDLWAVSLAAGRFASINLEKLDGEKETLNFFKNCIDTQKKFELNQKFYQHYLKFELQYQRKVNLFLIYRQ